MLIAVMSDRPDAKGLVPDTFEKSPWVLVIETDTGEIRRRLNSGEPMDLVNEIVSSGSEAVVTGPHIGKQCFDPIADAAITRYLGDGLDVMTAALAADRNRLPLLPEYEGGPGCTPNPNGCEDGHCG